MHCLSLHNAGCFDLKLWFRLSAGVLYATRPLERQRFGLAPDVRLLLFLRIVHSFLCSRPQFKLAMYGLGAAAVGGFVWYMVNRYHVAAPTQYIVRTGLFIPEISIAKKAFRWPLQRAFVLDITPTSYTFTAGAMTSEKLAFHLPMSFTIGPRNDPESLQSYARFLMQSEGAAPVEAGKGVTTSSKLETLVKGIIEGETRVLAASMTVDQIFGDRVALKERIVGVSRNHCIVILAALSSCFRGS